MRSVSFYQTELGEIGIVEENGMGTNFLFAGADVAEKAVVRETPWIQETSGQFRGYLAGKLHTFNIPHSPSGTEFLLRVWKELQAIPYGESGTYRQVAEHAGKARASRAAGDACNRNPIPLLIPCHRVVGWDGTLTGYRGGLERKGRLLDRERRFAHL
ncbi:MAG: methylated-DNA--[protein]-cysteine S-methyltransferase [Methanoregula sp.]|nr:methylated-DNA--[protein]-cysteine S-methyltransferase [Methanoregula sp.]